MATVATERKVFVGGEWVETGDWVEVHSPYSGEVVGRVAKAGAAEARKLAGEVVPMDASQAGEGKLAFTLRVPIGVVGAISPFNFPLNLVAHKLAPALASGCAVVLKPASQTPLSANLLSDLEEEAGLAPGWLSVLVGPAAEIGDVLVEDERVRAITFTGSGQVGWKLR